MASSKKKNQTDNFNSLGAREGGRVEKNAKKCKKKGKKMKKKNIFGGFQTNIKV